jgi:hypothetical protein
VVYDLLMLFFQCCSTCCARPPVEADDLVMPTLPSSSITEERSLMSEGKSGDDVADLFSHQILACCIQVQ